MSCAVSNGLIASTIISHEPRDVLIYEGRARRVRYIIIIVVIVSAADGDDDDDDTLTTRPTDNVRIVAGRLILRNLHGPAHYNIIILRYVIYKYNILRDYIVIRA